MPTFRPPVYTKVPHPTTGVMESCYQFVIDHQSSDKKITFIAEEPSDLSVATVQKCVAENEDWWNEFIRLFLESTKKLFAKPYTVQHIHKITKHSLKGSDCEMFPANVSMQPMSIHIQGGIVWFHWEYKADPIVIDIPELEEEQSLPVLPAEDELQELNVDDVPADENATEIELDSPTLFYDKQKVREARLKAKIALYKAQNQMAKFYEKYGKEYSDSDTESEYVSDEEDEEIQL